MPVRFGVVPDSGGAGRQRGGLAYVREYELLAAKATLTIRTDRRDHPPYGLDGGEPGAPSSNVVVSGGEGSAARAKPATSPAPGPTSPLSQIRFM